MKHHVSYDFAKSTFASNSKARLIYQNNDWTFESAGTLSPRSALTLIAELKLVVVEYNPETKMTVWGHNNELVALQTALNQLLSAFLFGGPLRQADIEEIAAQNHLKMATVPSQRKAVAKYYPPKEESES